MPARDDKDDRGERERAVVKEERLDVPRKVVDRDERFAERRGQRLGELQADEEATDQPRPWVTAMASMELGP